MWVEDDEERVGSLRRVLVPLVPSRAGHLAAQALGLGRGRLVEGPVHAVVERPQAEHRRGRTEHEDEGPDEGEGDDGEAAPGGPEEGVGRSRRSASRRAAHAVSRSV